MVDEMQRLVELQNLDMDIKAMTSQKASREQELEELESEQTRIEAMVGELQEKIDELEAECRELEQSLVHERDNMTRAEERLPAIKTQKEYVAVLKEIDTAKKFEKEIGEQIELKKGEAGGYISERDEKAGELESLQEKASSRVAEIKAESAEPEKQIASQEKTREKVFAAIPKPMQRKYQLLFDRRGGLAVVQAIQGACQGCNMHLPPQLFNSLMQVNEIQACPHCNRLLYVIEES